MILQDHYIEHKDENCDKCKQFLRLQGKSIAKIRGAQSDTHLRVAGNTDRETVAVDFDGVLHDHKNPIEGKRMGKPFPDALNAMRWLSERYYVVIYSVWGSEKGKWAIIDWCNYYHIPFDEVTNLKPKAKFYVDDNAIRHENWSETLAFIEEND